MEPLAGGKAPTHPSATLYSLDWHYHSVAGVDPEVQAIVPLFNPRQQQWADVVTIAPLKIEVTQQALYDEDK